MKVNLKMENLMEKVFMIFKQENMKVNSKMDFLMVMVKYNGTKVIITLDNLKMVNIMDKENIFGQMVESIKDNIKMDYEKVVVF